MRHQLQLTVVNSVGVLNRITAVIRKRYINVYELSTYPSTKSLHEVEISLDLLSEKQLREIMQQLNKLVEVLEVNLKE